MSNSVDELLVSQIRAGDADAWAKLIARYEGRLLAFARSRLGDRSAAEDVVQETFVGFVTSLPHYDASRSLEAYLFRIAAHKLTDHLRRQGRRQELSLSPGATSHGDSWAAPSADALPGPGRRASSIVRSGEHRRHEERALADALERLVADWIASGAFERLKCIELLFVRGWPNREVAERLGIAPQAVANHKFATLTKLREVVRQGDLLDELFPDANDRA
jgi:RNA polymerase sigma-70 factor (ECF subfamily)